MHEKRRSLRFVPSKGIPVSLHGDKGSLSAPLKDLSGSGLMVLLPECDGQSIKVGEDISGEIAFPDNPLPWHGRVIHRSPFSRGLALGIAAAGDTANSMRAASQWLAGLPDAGALQLQESQSSMTLTVIGYLSFEMGRDFLHLIRNRGVNNIDLSRCRSMDSAGLGMLCIARDQNIPIRGARDTVKTLLEVARIITAPKAAA